MPEGKKGLRYNIADNINERFYQLPKGLFLYPRYRSLDPQAKIMYAILRDRLQLSKVNRWIDDNGDIYLVFSQEKLADLMGFSQSAVSKTMKKLEDVGLLEKFKTGLHSLQRIYIHKLILPDQSEILEDVSEANLITNDNREVLETSLQKLKATDQQLKEQKIKQENPKKEIFPEEYMEVQNKTSKHSQRNIGKNRENTQTFPEEYMEVQNETSRHSQGNIHIFPEEYPNIPTGICRHSCRNTNDTKFNKTNFDTDISDTNLHTYSGSAADLPETVKNQKIIDGTPQLASLIELVKEELYSATVPMPAHAIKDISEAVSLYPMDMIQKAIERTIDIRYLIVMTLLLLYGAPDRMVFCLKYIFLLLLFRVFFLWMMRFEPVSTQCKESLLQLPMGFLPIFGLSFCLVFIFPFTGDIAFSFFSNVVQGYMYFAEQISGSPEILSGIFALMVFLLLCGEARRRSQPANVEEIWPFGDGDGWFLAAWGAAIDLGTFFMIFIFSQLILLILYAGKFILGSETLHE